MNIKHYLVALGTVCLLGACSNQSIEPHLRISQKDLRREYVDKSTTDIFDSLNKTVSSINEQKSEISNVLDSVSWNYNAYSTIRAIDQNNFIQDKARLLDFDTSFSNVKSAACFDAIQSSKLLYDNVNIDVLCQQVEKGTTVFIKEYLPFKKVMSIYKLTFGDGGEIYSPSDKPGFHNVADRELTILKYVGHDLVETKTVDVTTQGQDVSLGELLEK